MIGYIKQFFLFQKILFTLSCNSIYTYIYNDYSNYFMTMLYNDVMRNGCISIKLAQWIITRYNIIYDEKDKPHWLKLFDNIYENCDTHSIDYTNTIFHNETGEHINNYFKDFNNIPIASGSIGQVYKATTNDNKIVAVKVMHPNIEEQASVSIFFLTAYNLLLKKFKFLYKYAIPFDLDSFFEEIKKQIDFRYEYDNLVRSNKYYEKNELLIFPKPHFRSEKILITSFEDGDFFENLDITEYKKYKIIQLLSLYIRDSSIIKNFMHGDLHQGNWKVRKVNNEYAIVLYDLGVCFEFEKQKIQDFWYYWEKADKRELSNLFTKCIQYSSNKISKDEIRDGIYYNLTNIAIGPMDASKTISETLKYLNKNDIIMDRVQMEE